MKVMLFTIGSTHFILYNIPVSLLSGSVNGSDPDPIGPEKNKEKDFERWEGLAVSTVTWAHGRRNY